MHDHMKRLALDEEGIPMVLESNNLILDHIQYKVEYIYRRTEVLKSTIVA